MSCRCACRPWRTGGPTKIRGDSLQYALGLLDRLVFSIKKTDKRIDKTSAGQPSGVPLPEGSGTTAPMMVPSTAPAATSDG